VSLPTLRQKVEIELEELRFVAAEVERLLEKVERSQDLDYLGAIATNIIEQIDIDFHFRASIS
jgi:hypothetical protein